MSKSILASIGGALYVEGESQWPESVYPIGSHTFWAYVDSWGPPIPWAAVDESDETNNRSQPETFTVPEGAGGHPETVPTEPLPPHPLP